jgi:hypothetical protein
MSGVNASRSGANGIAGPKPPPPPVGCGSSSRDRNEFIIWNPTACAPVAASPDNCDSALPRFAPVSPNTPAKPGGRAPPLLKNELSALATFCWLRLNPLLGTSVELRSNSTSVAL